MIETTEMPVSDLRTFHKNPRVGDVDAARTLARRLDEGLPGDNVSHSVF